MEVTRPVLQNYQRHLYYYRQKNGEPLTFRSQYTRMVPVRSWFRWLAGNNHILHNPAADLDMPRIEQRSLPAVLSESEAERVHALADIDEPLGLRDRAMLETFYSTGIRRTELVNLKLYNLDRERGTLSIWQGKGKKDRIIPIGERAIAWINKYLREARPQLASDPDDGTVFLSVEGGPFHPDRLSHAGPGARRSGQPGQARGLPHVPPHDGHADARRRGRHPLHPGDARPLGPRKHDGLHAGVDPQAEENPHGHASRRGAWNERRRPRPTRKSGRGSIC